LKNSARQNFGGAVNVSGDGETMDGNLRSNLNGKDRRRADNAPPQFDCAGLDEIDLAAMREGSALRRAGKSRIRQPQRGKETRRRAPVAQAETKGNENANG
jgi:hypothetical protein